MHACKTKIEDSAVLKDWELAILGWDWGWMLVKVRLSIRLF